MEFFLDIVQYVKRISYTYMVRSAFRNFGSGSKVGNLRRLKGAKNISIGKNVSIQRDCWLFALGNKVEPTIQIGDGVSIGFACALIGCERVCIESNVLIADNVHITDNTFVFQDVHKPIKHQELQVVSEVNIGKNSWIGTNVVIIGAKLGRNCVVAANSVVTANVPDYCVVAGAPAKIIKKIHV